MACGGKRLWELIGCLQKLISAVCVSRARERGECVVNQLASLGEQLEGLGDRQVVVVVDEERLGGLEFVDVQPGVDGVEDEQWAVDGVDAVRACRLQDLLVLADGVGAAGREGEFGQRGFARSCEKAVGVRGEKLT